MYWLTNYDIDCKYYLEGDHHKIDLWLLAKSRNVSINIRRQNTNEHNENLPKLIQWLVQRNNKPVLEWSATFQTAKNFVEERLVLSFPFRWFAVLLTVASMSRGVSETCIADIFNQVVKDLLFFGHFFVPIWDDTKHQMLFIRLDARFLIPLKIEK